jgi:8-oxo-dGTP pyrophosphatase MutT (NUDIX family)
MAEAIKREQLWQSRKPRKVKSKSGPRSGLKSKKLGKSQRGLKWSGFRVGTLSTPLAVELMRDQLAPPPREDDPLLESGVLAYRREDNGDPLVLLISRRRSKKWGIPKGKLAPTLNFPENAAKEAFEEAGVIGYISPTSVGMFRARKKSTSDPPIQHTIEVWVYLLEVAELAVNWPEKGKREIRWVTCEDAARQFREPVLSQLCRRLAQS